MTETGDTAIQLILSKTPTPRSATTSTKSGSGGGALGASATPVGKNNVPKKY